MNDHAGSDESVVFAQDGFLNQEYLPLIRKRGVGVINIHHFSDGICFEYVRPESIRGEDNA